MTMAVLFQWLESSAVGVLVRESLYGFPAVVGLHILGLALSVGTLLWFDLRLVGVVLPGVPVTRVYRQLIPWAAVGFLLMGATGLMLFTGYAAAAAGNVFFRIKLAAMVLAGVNAFYYHRVTEPSAATWEHLARPPAGARLAGAVSLLLWTIVILCGRIMAYTMY